jgi:CheY-like chemotaxis protein
MKSNTDPRRYPGYPPRVLIADADPDTRTMYRQCLEAHGYTVDEAVDGPSALVGALSAPLHLVITDARLPIFDGFALCGVLRDDEATRTVPMIVITSGATACANDCSDMSGANVVFQKPVPLDSLLSEIARLLTEPIEQRLDNGATGSVAHLDDGTRRRSLRKSWARRHCVTTSPPAAPPALRCRLCDEPLAYCRSFVGGVNARRREQWDEYSCPSGCATFEYRHRSRSVREH